MTSSNKRRDEVKETVQLVRKANRHRSDDMMKVAVAGISSGCGTRLMAFEAAYHALVSLMPEEALEASSHPCPQLVEQACQMIDVDPVSGLHYLRSRWEPFDETKPTPEAMLEWARRVRLAVGL
jgi:hypothetical protein